MKKIIISLFTIIAFTVCAQNSSPIKVCGTQAPSREWDEWFNQKVNEFKQSTALQKEQSNNYVIPVVFHVIHGGQNIGSFPNLSQAQINSQITILNNDFAGTGLNVGNLANTGFSSTLIANCHVTFCLADKNPSGVVLSEKGIDRINYVTKNWLNPTSFSTNTNFMNYVNSTIKPNSIWDPTKYLNIWISDVNAVVGLLGYATFPSGTNLSGLTSGLGTATTDGVWCWSKSIGDVGTLTTKYDKGRTATHEIGHWLGLRHIWGDASCGDDFCNDTPTQQQSNSGCPSFPHVTCSNGINGDMFMNFMDYSDDACLYMFTNDQNARIQTAMANCPYRQQLTANSTTLCSNVAACSYTLSNFSITDTLANPFAARRATASVNETFCTQGFGKAGYMVGTNCYGDKEKAEFIGISKYTSVVNPIITGAVVLFYQYGSNGTDGTANINLSIYDGSTASSPGTLLGSTTENLATIVASTNTNSVNYCGDPNLAFGVPLIMPYKFTFPTPINAPSSGGFFASISIPNTPNDTVVIFDKLTASTNAAWEKWNDNSWHDMKTAWGGKRSFNLAILPIIECSAVGLKKYSELYNNINIFPNPSSGSFKIITTLPHSIDLSVKVYNSLGQLVYIDKFNNVAQNVIDVNLNNQPNGLYFVEISNGQEKNVQRVMLLDK